MLYWQTDLSAGLSDESADFSCGSEVWIFIPKFHLGVTFTEPASWESMRTDLSMISAVTSHQAISILSENEDNFIEVDNEVTFEGHQSLGSVRL